MKTYIRIIAAMLSLVLLLATGCSALAPAATPIPLTEREYAEAPAEEAWYPDSSAPMPTATAGDAFGPSTGGTDEPNDQPYGDVFFEDYGVNPRVDTEDDTLSTFAVDVDTGAYTVMRRYINDGYLPPDESVRVEEYVNFFDQGYAPPAERAFAIHIDGAPSPYAPNYHLVRVGLQGYEIPPEEREDVVLTFVIDVSGSMEMENRLELVKDALGLLVGQLRPTDEIGIVVYGSNARVLLPHTPVAEERAIFKAIRRLQPEGATNAEEGLHAAYQMAWEAFDPGAINRVILCSDGVANVGNTGPDSIMTMIEDYAAEGIYLTSVGFGMGNYNDVLMEQLADKGDGFYAYVDDLKEAERVFVHDLTGTLQVIARDAKVQVAFNPDVISRYRLIGYENRDVADEDFRNDRVDAGEIGVGHSVTALYEVKFHQDAPDHDAALTVYMRWEDPDTGEVAEINRSFARADLSARFEDAAPRFQLTAVVAEYAEVLRDSYWAKDAAITLADVAQDARRVAEYLPGDADVQEFVQLATGSETLSATQ